MKHTSYSLLFCLRISLFFCYELFYQLLACIRMFSLAGTNSVIVLSTHDVTPFILIFLRAHDSFFIMSLEPYFLSTSITKVSLTKLFSSYSLLLLSLLFPYVQLFYSTLSSSPSSSLSLKLCSKCSHSARTTSFRSSWKRFRKNSGHTWWIRHLIHLWWEGTMFHSRQTTWFSELDNTMLTQDWFFFTWVNEKNDGCKNFIID